MTAPDTRITQDELARIFGPALPIIAVKLLFPEKSEPLTHDELRDVLRAIAAWNRRPTLLAEALAWIKKHGVHADDCETVTRQDEPQFSFYEMQDHLDAVSAICTCGLTAILRAAGEGRADG